MKILLTGGCGYKGAVLAPKLLAAGHRVTVFDTQWFGNPLAGLSEIEFIKDDIRSVKPGGAWETNHLPKFGACIHLAGIANDPCGELDARLTWQVNVRATKQLAEACAKAGLRQFLFASSASVYGIKGNAEVTEETPEEPVSDYNETKMCAERVLLSYARQMKVQIVRPATVCGVSPRMRLDTVVNMLTAQALASGAITAHTGSRGAKLMRPNVHIEDITDLYVWLLARPQITGVWNAGFENLTVGATAELIAQRVPTKITWSEVPDKRSYAVSSVKLLKLGFEPKRSVRDAIGELVDAWRAGRVKDDERCYNLKWMRKQKLVREVA
jgi:nucleoside-diphosphate-sugar epimerase